MEDFEELSPYCKVCEGCGEEGCCSPLICQQSPNGEYCEGYLLDLKFGYRLNRFFEENIYEHLEQDLKRKADDAYHNIYNEVYLAKESKQ